MNSNQNYIIEEKPSKPMTMPDSKFGHITVINSLNGFPTNRSGSLIL